MSNLHTKRGFKKAAWFFWDEEQLIHILKHLPNEDTFIRPVIQEAGRNLFRW